ncbi:MAG: hypothetical protein M3115_06415 [Thermoproteota archaeon]|nr:hypothetical protein [Thermoproteota archaeon]
MSNTLGQSNNNRTTKAKTAIPIAGILVATALLSGLFSIISSQTAIAQQNITGGNATAAGNATAGNATAAGNQTGNATTMGGNNTAGTTNGSGLIEGIFGG